MRVLVTYICVNNSVHKNLLEYCKRIYLRIIFSPYKIYIYTLRYWFQAVAHLHTIEMPFDRNPIIFFNCKKWLSKADELAYVYIYMSMYLRYQDPMLHFRMCFISFSVCIYVWGFFYSEALLKYIRTFNIFKCGFCFRGLY